MLERKMYTKQRLTHCSSTAAASAYLWASCRAGNGVCAHLSGGANSQKVNFQALQRCRCVRLPLGHRNGLKTVPVHIFWAKRNGENCILGHCNAAAVSASGATSQPQLLWCGTRWGWNNAVFHTKNLRESDFCTTRRNPRYGFNFFQGAHGTSIRRGRRKRNPQGKRLNGQLLRDIFGSLGSESGGMDDMISTEGHSRAFRFSVSISADSFA